MVLSPSMLVLHMSHHAQILITGLMPTTLEAQQPTNRTDILPPVLINLAGVILSVLQSRHEIGEKGQIEIRYSVNKTGLPVFIRGVGVPNVNGLQGSRIVFVFFRDECQLRASLTDFLAAILKFD